MNIRDSIVYRKHEITIGELLDKLGIEGDLVAIKLSGNDMTFDIPRILTIDTEVCKNGEKK